jgi:hypothetical protein
MTDPGVYDGFELLECPEQPTPDFEVRGLGQHWYMDVEPSASNRVETVEAFSSEVVIPAIGRVPALVLSGIGTLCSGVGGPSVLLESWADVDSVVAAVGAALRDEDLMESVAISVTGEVCPD